MSDQIWLTLELSDRQMLDGALLMLYLLAIQIHSLIGWRKVYRVQRFSERNQRLYVVFSLRKVVRLMKEIILDHIIFFACFVLWIHGIMATTALSESELAQIQDAAVGEGEWQMPVKVVVI